MKANKPKTEQYLDALQQISDWATVSEWAIKVGELHPELLAKAEKEALAQANETTGLRELAARIGSGLARNAYKDNIEIDTSERPRKVRYVSTDEHAKHIKAELDEDVAPLKRGEIIERDKAKLSVQDVYRLGEFETISKQLKDFFGLEFEVDHSQALLNAENPGDHSPDNLQLLLKIHNGKKHNKNWPRFTIEEQVSYILSAIALQKTVATRFDITCDESVLESLVDRLKTIY